MPRKDRREYNKYMRRYMAKQRRKTKKIRKRIDRLKKIDHDLYKKLFGDLLE